MVMECGEMAFSRPESVVLKDRYSCAGPGVVAVLLSAWRETRSIEL